MSRRRICLPFPIEVVLVPVEEENPVRPAAGPSHSLAQPRGLLRRTDPLFRGQPEVGFELRQAQRTDVGRGHAVERGGSLAPL
jgi:hypothetical protein